MNKSIEFRLKWRKIPCYINFFLKHSSRDSGLPSDWEQERWNRQRADSVSGSDFGGRGQRKLSNTSCPPSVKTLPHSASVFDLNVNNQMQHLHPHHGFVPVQQVTLYFFFFLFFFNYLFIIISLNPCHYFSLFYFHPSHFKIF